MAVTKFFRVATSGRTVDGREITPAQIDEMAASYDPQKYGARIWMEHMRSYLSDGPFRAYGDVIALKAEAAGDGSRVLLAQVDATADLVKMSGTDRQKVYWSIEIDTNFTGTGKAYMVGLGVTDTPASLGTERITFAQTLGKAPDAAKGHLFSTVLESAITVEPPAGPSLLDKVRDLLSSRTKTDDARFIQQDQAITAVAEAVAEIKSGGAFAEAAAITTVSDQVAALKTQLDELTTRLSSTPNHPPRSLTAGLSAINTDC